MSRKLYLIVIAIVCAALPLAGQGMQHHPMGAGNGVRAHAGGAPGQGTISHLDLAAKTVLEGVVDGISMGRGQGTPSFTMVANGKKVVIVASPFRALLDADYKISIGDRMNVTAYPFREVQDTLAAAELRNLTTGAILTLRDENGVPIMADGYCGNCPYHPAGQSNK